jgi:hypothetical protein
MSSLWSVTALLLVGAASPALAAPTFAGRWETTFGPMTLNQEGALVSGAYSFAGKRCTLLGKVVGTPLAFTYQEPSAKGEGSFELAADGRTFRGTWRQQGSRAGGEWTGKRMQPGFDGLWDTSFGRMRLVQNGRRIRGVYSGGASLGGELSGGKFTFRYQEPSARGEGWFTLVADGRRFQGKWRETGKEGWSDWQGKRMEPLEGKVWLVVLEVPWERGLDEEEFSFGRMLRAFFARSPNVQVRHKIVNSEKGLRRWCGELAFLAEPVVLVIASHGSQQGIAVGGKAIGAAPLAHGLRYADNVRLVHFSACQIMKSNLARDIGEGLSPGRRLPISGYTTSADWAASAVIEFMYLDLILGRGMAPEAAGRQLLRLIPFAGDRTESDVPFGAAGFRLQVVGPGLAK